MPFVIALAQSESGGVWVEPIPISWLSLDKTQARFPKSDKDLRKFCRNQVEPEDDWPTYSVIVKSMTFLTYEDALEKCKDYVDDNTGTDSNLDEVFQPSSKRQKRAVQHFATEQAIGQARIPASIKSDARKSIKSKKLKHKLDLDDSSSSNHSDDLDSNYEPPKIVSSFSTPTAMNPLQERVSISMQTSQSQSSFSVPNCRKSQSLHKLASVTSSLFEVANATPTSMNQVSNGSNFEAMMIRKVNVLDQKLNEALNLLQVIINNNEHHEKENVPFQLPLNSLEDLVILNEFLKIEDNRTIFLKHIPRNIHSELTSRVSTMLGTLFSDQLAMQLNWKGTGKVKEGKKKEGLKNFTYIYAFIVQYFGNAADLAMPKVKKWLANASSRCLSKATISKEGYC